MTTCWEGPLTDVPYLRDLNPCHPETVSHALFTSGGILGSGYTIAAAPSLLAPAAAPRMKWRESACSVPQPR